MSNLIEYCLVVNNKVKDEKYRLLASSLTYYIVLAIVPIVSLIFYFSSMVISDPQPLIDVLTTLIDPSMAVSIIDFALTKEINNHFGLIITMGLSIWIVSNGFHKIISVMDSMYQVREERYFLVRIRAIMLTIIMCLVISLTIIISSIIPILFDHFNLTSVWLYLQYPAYITFVFSATAVFYKVGPGINLPYKAVYPGSAFCGLTMLTIIFGYNIYAYNYANYSNIYGPITNLVIILIMFHLLSYVIYIGLCMNVINYEKKIKTLL